MLPLRTSHSKVQIVSPLVQAGPCACHSCRSVAPPPTTKRLPLLPVARVSHTASGATKRRFQAHQPRPARAASVGRYSCQSGRPCRVAQDHALRQTLLSSKPGLPKLSRWPSGHELLFTISLTLLSPKVLNTELMMMARRMMRDQNGLPTITTVLLLLVGDGLSHSIPRGGTTGGGSFLSCGARRSPSRASVVLVRESAT